MVSEWISFNHEWEKTVFVDEKVFSLDGPPAWKSYVHEKEENIRNIRVNGGGKIMVWLICFTDGLVWHKVFRSNFNVEKYVALLKENVLKLIKLNMDTYFYQEDNSGVHKAKIVSKFMHENAVQEIGRAHV